MMSYFQFWRDCRPPFVVTMVGRVDVGTDQPRLSTDVVRDPMPRPPVEPAWEQGAIPHPDGELYNVHWECGIEYTHERLCNIQRDNSTFDAKIRGVAQVRLPNAYPEKGQLHILSWGQPSLNWLPEEDASDRPGEPGAFVNPKDWMPIAGELTLRADGDRMAACRMAVQRAAVRTQDRKRNAKRMVDIGEIQGLTLGPHAALPRLAKMEKKKAEAQEELSASTKLSDTFRAQTAPAGAPRKQRTHRIWTQASGFVTYAG